MPKKLGVECPCGFSFVAPHGEDEAVAVVQLHIDHVYKKDFLKGISRSEALKDIKEVK